MQIVPDSALRGWTESLEYMQKALAILDRSRASGDIGSHLDLAICRLEQDIEANALIRPWSSAIEDIEQALAEAENSTTKDVEVW